MTLRPIASEGPLLSAVMVRKHQAWVIAWADIPFFRPGGRFQTLAHLVQTTEGLLHESGGTFWTLDMLVEATDLLVSRGNPSGSGTLQYKIYPWGRPGLGDERSPVDAFLLGVPQPENEQSASEERWPLAFDIYGNPGDLQVAVTATGNSLGFRASTATDLINQVTLIYGELPHTFTWIRTIRSLHGSD